MSEKKLWYGSIGRRDSRFGVRIGEKGDHPLFEPVAADREALAELLRRLRIDRLATGSGGEGGFFLNPEDVPVGQTVEDRIKFILHRLEPPGGEPVGFMLQGQTFDEIDAIIREWQPKPGWPKE